MQWHVIERDVNWNLIDRKAFKNYLKCYPVRWVTDFFNLMSSNFIRVIIEREVILEEH